MSERTIQKPPFRDAEVAALKVPPHSIEAEQAVLGGIMLDNEAWDRAMEHVSEADFYRQDHRLIYRVMTALAKRGSPLDVLTLSESLKDIGELDNAGGEVYLFEIAKNIPSSANIVAYANIVRERAVFRQLLDAVTNIASTVYRPEGRHANELLDEAERRIFAIANQYVHKSGPEVVSEWMAKAVERIDTIYRNNEPITGVSTGYTDFDQMTAGLQKGDLVIVAGRPSMGKTTFAMNIAEYAAVKDDKPVLVFSMEMPGDSLAMRMISSMGRIEHQKLRTGDLNDSDWHRITGIVGQLAEANLYIDETPALSPAEVRARARRLARDKGQLGLIVLDYMQLMQIHGHKENRTAEISEISRSLKTLAKELNVPVIALSQLNRSLEARQDKRPILSDLRESGAIEQDADVIAFVYRDEVYNEATPDKGIAEIIIAKQRNGPIGKTRLTFLGHLSRFENYQAQAVPYATQD
ncbi:MAG: replicative DNA helicase [marine bacterium B5-7]|nr:MAG: replicative DNA helicase [marine bacterium B5-7]